MTTPKVQYSYANGSGNQIRPTRTTYPDGRELNLDYGSAGSQADLLSRVAAQVDDDGSTHLADSSYLGLGTPVITDYTQPDVRYTLVGTAGGNDPDTGDIYRGLDRFGRVKNAYWRDYGANADAARIQYGYDRASNRTYRADPVAVANSAQYEELYGYDGLQRLAHMQRGTLNGSKTGLTAQSFDQCWTLDPTGNWKGFRQDDTGNGSWDLIQARTSNPVNEITNISNSVGSAWANPAYNAAGNMTTIPQPADPTQSFAATYDAWNRLVKLQDGANTVAEYQYDARNYRTVAKSYAGGVLDETRHFYYTIGWQDIEERLGTSPDSADPNRQFVWGQRYIDDCVLRDRDTNGDGTLDERLYALQDANWNVIALTDTSGDVQERYAYQAYGTPKFLTPAFGNRASSSFGWETLFCGYRFDAQEGIIPVRNRSYLSNVGIWCQRDPFNYNDGMNLYAAWFVPMGTDPFGLLCTIGIHCWPVVRWGITLSRHCGITMTDGTGTYWVDNHGPNAAGEVSISIIDREWALPNFIPGVIEYEAKEYPDSTCECIREYVSDVWNPAKIKYGAGTTNSNFAFKCVATKCGVEVPATHRHTGWDCGTCRKWHGAAGSGSGCGSCLEWEKCPCPTISKL